MKLDSPLLSLLPQLAAAPKGVNSHESFRFSVTCRSAEEAVLHCLKALADFAESGGHKKDNSVDAAVAEWHRDERVTLRFTTPDRRDAFRRIARDLLQGRWAEYDARDDDPPPPLGITFRPNGDAK